MHGRGCDTYLVDLSLQMPFISIFNPPRNWYAFSTVHLFTVLEHLNQKFRSSCFINTAPSPNSGHQTVLLQVEWCQTKPTAPNIQNTCSFRLFVWISVLAFAEGKLQQVASLNCMVIYQRPSAPHPHNIMSVIFVWLKGGKLVVMGIWCAFCNQSSLASFSEPIIRHT